MDNNTNIENQTENQELNTKTEVSNLNDNTHETKPKKKKRRTGRIILNVFTFILLIAIILEAALGIINMQRISNKEEPIWYFSTKTTETELKTVTEYHLGLYRIVKTDTSKETKITLKPFFMEG